MMDLDEMDRLLDAVDAERLRVQLSVNVGRFGVVERAYMEACAPGELRALITRLRAAEARVDDLRAGLERVVKRCAEGGEQALSEAQCALEWDDDREAPRG